MRRWMALGLVLTVLTAGVWGGEVVLKSGYEPGQPTMDLDAALQWAKKNNRPVFLDFTGSDWCYWCQLMQSKVFSQSEWSDWAKGQIAYVTIDFPQNASLVPAAFRDRNQKLQSRFGVEGYPTYIILDADGVTELGRLGASQDVTAPGFIGQVQGVTRYARSSLNLLLTKLSGDQQAKLKQNLQDLQSLSDYIAEWKQRKAESQLDTVKKAISEVQTAYAESRLAGADRDAYAAAGKRRKAKQDELEAWLATRPKNTSENQQKYQALQAAVAVEQAAVDALVMKYAGAP